MAGQFEICGLYGFILFTTANLYAAVAQLVERWPEEPSVGGAEPSCGTIWASIQIVKELEPKKISLAQAFTAIKMDSKSSAVISFAGANPVLAHQSY